MDMQRNWFITIKLIFTLSLSIIFKSAFSQNDVSKIVLKENEINIGEIQAAGTLLYETTLYNTTDKSIFLLRTDVSELVSTKTTTKTILAKDSLRLFIEFKPTQTGKFSQKIRVYFSDANKPSQIVLKGSINAIQANLLQQCNNFSRTKNVTSSAINQNKLTITVLDSITKRPIENLSIDVSYENTKKLNLITNQNGSVKLSVADVPVTIEINDSHFKPYSSKRIYSLSSPKQEVYLVPNDTYTSTEYAKQVFVEPIIESSNKFSEKEFKPNNLVFLIDVSASMKEENKIEDLKQSLKNLIAFLRPIDSVSIITYSSFAALPIEAKSAKETELFNSVIDTIKAKGQTSGRRAILEAYAICFNHYQYKANNQIILITDGAFSIVKSDEEKLLEYKRNGIKMSVLAIKPERTDYKSLKKIAKLSGGNILVANEPGDFYNLFTDEIKNQCKKSPNDF
ncbi:MAG: VWA domain-containing protein [Bacteroidota bacterium]